MWIGLPEEKFEKSMKMMRMHMGLNSNSFNNYLKTDLNLPIQRKSTNLTTNLGLISSLGVAKKSGKLDSVKNTCSDIGVNINIDLFLLYKNTKKVADSKNKNDNKYHDSIIDSDFSSNSSDEDEDEDVEADNEDENVEEIDNNELKFEHSSKGPSSREDKSSPKKHQLLQLKIKAKKSKDVSKDESKESRDSDLLLIRAGKTQYIGINKIPSLSIEDIQEQGLANSKGVKKNIGRSNSNTFNSRRSNKLRLKILGKPDLLTGLKLKNYDDKSSKSKGSKSDDEIRRDRKERDRKNQIGMTKKIKTVMLRNKIIVPGMLKELIIFDFFKSLFNCFFVRFMHTWDYYFIS